MKKSPRAAMEHHGRSRDLHFSAVKRLDVPQGRNGKHRNVVSNILSDLSKLSAKEAVKIPLASLNGEKIQNLRSALNRATRERKLRVETTTDVFYMYVWRVDPPLPGTRE